MTEYRNKLTDKFITTIKKVYKEKYPVFEGRNSKHKKIVADKFSQLIKYTQSNVHYMQNEIDIIKSCDDVFFHSLVQRFLRKTASCYLELASGNEMDYRFNLH